MNRFKLFSLHAFNSLIYLTLVTQWLMPTAVPLYAQSVVDAPRADYYLAREFYETGRLADASEAFRLVLQRSMRVRDQAWIDSIPPMVMLGESYFQMGKVAQAMEQYDAALMVALAYPNWIEQVVAPVDLQPLDNKSKGINWFAPSRATQSTAIPEPGQLAVNPAGGGVGQPMAVSTRVNSAEVLRTMGLALVRRNEILGPLAKHSPLAEQLRALFERDLAQPALWAKSAWRLLRGFHALSVPSDFDPLVLINENALIGGNVDYFMTPLALLELGKQQWFQKDLATALPHWQDASLVAARYEQYSMLAESLQTLTAACAAANRTDLLPAIQNAAEWGVKRSATVQACGFAGAAELATMAGDWPAAAANSKQAAAALRIRDVVLPRAQAQLFFANAITAFGENRGILGQQALESALKIMRGNAQDGALAKQIFQSQMVLNLLQGNALQATDAEQALEEILREPGSRQWQTEPLETIAAMTTSAVPAYATWLDLAVRRGTQDQIIERMDRILRQRFYEAAPMGGRLFSLRAAVLSDQQQLPPDVQASVTQALRSSASLTASTQRLVTLTQSLDGLSLPIEEKQLNIETKKFYTDLTKAMEQQETQLALQALRRQPFDRFIPFAASLVKIQASLDESDLAIAFVSTGGKLYGAAISKSAVETWTVADNASIETLIKSLLADIGLTTPSKVIPSQATSPEAAWRETASNLFAKLFPSATLPMIDSARRIVIVPDASLWYLPFELLPSATRSQNTWLASHPIVYLPTLGSISTLDLPAPAASKTLHIAASYFSPDKTLNESLTAKLMQGTAGYHRADLGGKSLPPAAHWSRLLVDQLVVTSKIESSQQPWETNFLPLDSSRFSQLIGWSESPKIVPGRVLFPGYQTSAATGNVSDGQELFIPACALLYSGTRNALISRWPVGGRSSQTVLSRYMQELTFETPSKAWQRATVAMWADEFWIADEPAMLPSGKETAALVSGLHPKLWSGYMVIGDSQPPPTPLP